MVMVDVRLNAKRISTPFEVKIVSNKLVFSAVFIYDICLPAKEFIYQCSLEFLELCAKTSIDGSSHIREIFPCIDAVAPVVQAKLMIHCIQIIVEFLSEIFYKLLLNIFSGSSVIFCFVIYLETNDTFSVCSAFH